MRSWGVLGIVLSCDGFIPRLPLSCDGLPTLDQVFRCSPRQGLSCQGWITSAAGPHYRSSENAQVRGFVRKAPPVYHVGVRVVAHAGSSVGVCGECGNAGVRGFDRDGARFTEPFRHFLLGVADGASFVLFWASGGDPAYRVAQWVSHRGIEVEKTGLV